MMGAYLAVLIFLVSGTGNDLADYMPAWELKLMYPTPGDLLKAAAAPAPADIANLIQQLGDNDPDVRQKAYDKIVAVGPPAGNALAAAVNSPDAEISARAQAALDAITPAVKRLQFNRLIAIRALGQSHPADALPVLKPLLVDPDFFIRDYAREAILRIDPKAILPPATAPASQPADPSLADIDLMPARCDVLLQLHLNSGDLRHARHIPVLQAARALAALKPGGPPGAMLDPRTDADTSVREMTLNLMPLAQEIGNFRVDSITAGLWSDDVNKPGAGFFILRGLYDSHAVALYLNRRHIPYIARDNIGMFTPETETNGNPTSALVLVSDRELVYVTSQDAAHLDLPEVARLARGQAPPPGDKQPMIALLQNIDRHSFLWSTARPTPGLRQLLPALDDTTAATLTVQMPAPAANSPQTQPAPALTFTLTATLNAGVAPQPLTQSLQRWLDTESTHLHHGPPQLDRNAAPDPSRQALAAALHEVKIQSDAGNITLTGQLPLPESGGLLGRLFARTMVTAD